MCVLCQNLAMAKRGKSNDADAGPLLAVVAAVVFVVVLYKITHGWIMLLFGLAIAGWLILRQRRKEREAAAAAAYRGEQLRIAADLGRLLTLTPTEFEHIVGTVLAGLGFTAVQHVGRSRDRGVDLLCCDPHGRRTVVQCKQYAISNKVTGPAVRNLIGAASQARAQHAMLVTTSSFTAEARTAAQSTGLALIDGATLSLWARAAHGMPAGPASLT